MMPAAEFNANGERKLTGIMETKIQVFLESLTEFKYSKYLRTSSKGLCIMVSYVYVQG